MKRFFSTAFALAVLAAVSGWSRQNSPAQRSALAAERGSGWKTVAPGMELRFLVAQKEGVQRIAPDFPAIEQSLAAATRGQSEIAANFRRGRAKVELGLAKGKKLYDKREAIKRKTARREVERELRHRNR